MTAYQYDCVRDVFSQCKDNGRRAVDVRVAGVVRTVSQVLLGKTEQIQLALACLLARGHLLIEDLPGMGKTILSQALAGALGLDYSRVQFTSDLLPADILGGSVFDSQSRTFEFQPGPIFTQVLMADEINRTTPKTQSALLEAMEERQVTTDGVTRPLPVPFFVIATQNPSFQAGTYALPESQLDRFLMRIRLGFPDAASEKALMQGRDRRSVLSEIQPALDLAGLQALQEDVAQVAASDALIDYAYRLVRYTRDSEDFEGGLSPRGNLALIQAARAWALIQDRAHVLPEDIQAVLGAVIDHRLQGTSGQSPAAGRLLHAVDVLN